MRWLAVLTILLMASFPASASAQTWFESCAAGLAKPSFKALAAYLTASDNLLDKAVPYSHPGECFRLNNHEFLVLPKLAFGIYHCNFTAKGNCALYDGQPGRLWEMPAVFKEFTDNAGKHFVLLKQVALEHGAYSEVYDVLYLVPPSSQTDGLPFVMQMLVTASMNSDSGSLTDDFCNQLSRQEFSKLAKTADGIRAVDVGNNRQGNATVTVQIVKEDCKTQKKANSFKVFNFDGKTFVEHSG